MKLTKLQFKQIINEELTLMSEKGFGQGTPPSGEFYKKREVVLEEEEEEKNNPWAICTSSVGREDKAKYERCVMKVKRELKENKLQQIMKEEVEIMLAEAKKKS